MGDPRNPALEAAIANDPFDREAYLVYADWLDAMGIVGIVDDRRYRSADE